MVWLCYVIGRRQARTLDSSPRPEGAPQFLGDTALDPTKPVPYAAPAATDDADLANLMGRQLTIAGILQDALLRDQNSLTTRELRDLSSSASTLLSLSHRTEQALAQLTTYRSFVSVVLEFLKSRSDSLGEDLLAELRKTGAEMRTPADAMALIE